MPLTDLPFYVVDHTWATILHNWPFMALGILAGAALKVWVGPERIGALLRKRTDAAVAGSVAVAVATPFCSCGTTAVVLAALAASVPWAPVVAFMVASPLSSRDGLFITAGLFGWPLAIYVTVVSVILGIAGGVVAHLAENAGLLRNQARFLERAAAAEAPAAPAPASSPAPSGCGCGGPRATTRPSLGPGAAAVAELAPRPFWVRARLPEIWSEVRSGTPKLVAMFVGFAAIGYLALGIIPTAWLTTLLGGSSPLSVLIAATAGVPFYVSDGSLPLVASLRAGGMGAGPTVAFLITGSGTSIAAISGGLLIARWRVIAIVVGTLWVGAIVFGLLAQAIL